MPKQDNVQRTPCLFNAISNDLQDIGLTFQGYVMSPVTRPLF